MPQNSFDFSSSLMLWYASLMSTHDSTSHLDFPSILKMSLSKGFALLRLRMRVLSSLKSTIGLLSRVIFLVISMTGEVWLVLVRVRIPNSTSLFICLSIMGLSSSAMGNGRTKKGLSSTTSIVTRRLGHSPI